MYALRSNYRIRLHLKTLRGLWELAEDLAIDAIHFIVRSIKYGCTSEELPIVQTIQCVLLVML